MTTALSMRGLRKSYGPNEVLRGVDLDFVGGEVHALLGPNGAGKSTLLGCLSGAVRPDSGVVVIGDDTHEGFTPQQAFDAGTAIIYQHFQLIDDLSVADNLYLGGELKSRSGTTRIGEQVATANRVLRSVGADFDATQLVGTLSVGQRQLVEIAKAIRHRPSLLILDEPTAALSADEAQLLLGLVQRLAHDDGIAVVYVTHLLREVLQVSDRVTVLRDGEVLWTHDTAELGMDDLIAAISTTAGQAASADSRPASSSSDRVLLDVRDFSVAGSPPIDLSVHDGEIVGIFGLLGSGRTNLVEGLAGVRPTAGTVTLSGREVSTRSPSHARADGVVLVASDRKEQSLFGSMSAMENLLMPHYSVLSTPWRKRSRESQIFDGIAEMVHLRPARATLEADSFSGGNAQKLAVGRWLGQLGTASVMLLDEPTQGVDVGAREEIYHLLRTFARLESKAVLFVSSDPEEVLALADRIVVLVDSVVAGVLPATVDEQELVALAHSDGPAGAAFPTEGLSHV
ncbi:sugar ABC transporter ATP-binding protein [Aeromicrobium endophyticum]|uniref:Sugar ABC transporter ATP-binding protein n=1 Tax=Aeromicrobium endophyticum TaxID=2292704 RepID=A0A371NZQ4_9ACTN|nr:sugar ABC transporter ATP-binding protein [Aeromicrobium endophyticum]REK68878.1 sugar ABC transporter ATP-binding protein [Aeromicrobium endophyticum]